MKTTLCLAAVLASSVLLGGCGDAATKSAPTVTVTNATTVTQAPSSTSATYGASTPSSTTFGSDLSSAVPAGGGSAIRSVLIEVSSSDKVGPNLLQLDSYGKAFVNVDVRSRGQDGDLRSEDCALVVDVTGPGNYDERQRSSDCTEDFSYPSAKAPGVYTVKATITPPGASQPTVATQTFKVVGAGQ